VKGGLRRLLRGDDEQQGTVLTIITDVSRRVSALATRALMLVKLYVISRSDEEGIPRLDMSFMLNALRVVGKQTARGYKSEQRCDLAAFYDTHFKPLLPPGDDPPSCEHLGNVLRYAAANLFAVFETNITQHYVEYVEAYVNAMWGKRATLEWIESLPREERKQAKATLLASLRAIKTDLLSVKDNAFKSSCDLHAWIHEHRRITLPAKKRYAENSLKYDLACHTQDYLCA
jgi:hypothetical protein